MAGLRELGADDEPALQRLLRRVYGETYSYRRLYEPGGVTSLLATGRVSLWGDFTEAEDLASHTGFFYKDPRRDYVESGMSLRHPALRPMTSDAEAWRRFFAWLDHQFAYVHQNTTTYHPLAQRYAERYMRARPAGFIIDYAVGERLVAIATPTTRMHALVMTTPLGSQARPVVRIPCGAWAEYLAAIAAGLGLASEQHTATEWPAVVDAAAIEHNPAIDLTRRSIARAGGVPLAPSGARTDLLHVPLDQRAGAIAAAARAGYVPVGLRPHATRPHELVMQYLPGERRACAREAFTGMRLAAPGAALAASWSKACARAT